MTDNNTGYWNTITSDTVNCFNVSTLRRDWDDATKPDWLYKPQTSTWVDESDMTDVEKIDNPTFRMCCGYLRVNDWKQEWRDAYASASDDDIQAVRDLPNFDAAVFEEITGLDLRIPKPACAGKIVEIDGVEYTLTPVK